MNKSYSFCRPLSGNRYFREVFKSGQPVGKIGPKQVLGWIYGVVGLFSRNVFNKFNKTGRLDKSKWQGGSSEALNLKTNYCSHFSFPDQNASLIMNFVFVSLQPINTDRESTSTHLARELSKNHKVLYVNPPINRKTLYAGGVDTFQKEHIETIRNGSDNLTRINTNLWVLKPTRVIESINWLPFTSVFKVFNRINNKRFARDIQAALNKLEFGNFTLINDKDIFRSFYLKEILKPDKYIYLDRDYTVGVEYWKKHGRSLEPQLMKKSDAVVCNSTDFTKRAKLYNPNSFYIGNGGDIESEATEQEGATADRPADLENIPRPLIGYVGALTTLRLNLDLLIRLATTRPDWSFVLIGSEDKNFRDSPLHGLPNVHFLGRKHNREVPFYILSFDVCLNPQAINEMTAGNFPMKIVEYLALGKPVVATATNTMKEVFAEQTYLADDLPSFTGQIETALREKNSDFALKRKAFAKNFSWEKVVAALLHHVN